MQRVSILTPLVVGLLAVSCGSSEDTSIATSSTKLTLLPTTTTSTTTTTTVPETTSTTSPATTVATTSGASTTAPPVISTTTTTTDPVKSALVLGDDGIGAAVFSGDPDSVVTYFSSLLGPPSSDTGWVDPFEISACAGSELRVVAWGSLRLTFGDVSPVLEGRRHFFSYTYGNYSYDGTTVTPVDQSPDGLTTTAGVGLGTDLVAVEAAYPAVALNPPDDFFPETFNVNDNLRGALTGLADDSFVVSIIGGFDCADPT